MSDETENEQIAAALEAAQEKVSASRLIDDPAAPATEERRTSFDGGARTTSPPAESPEEAHQQFIADLLTGGQR